MRFAIFAVVVLLAAACATSTPYGPANGGYGFSDQKIEDNRYRVTFRGNASTSRETVENFLLYRAAELTLENGFDYFIVVESDTEAKTTYSHSSYYPAYYGRYDYYYGSRRYHRHFPYYASGFDWAHPYESYTREITRYSASAFVTLHHGEKPTDDPHAFDARQIVDNLETFVAQSRQPQ